MRYLCGLGEDEFGVFHQTLQRHSNVDDFGPLVFFTVVCNKLSIPGVENDETYIKQQGKLGLKKSWK